MLITDFLSTLDTVVPLSSVGYGRDAIGLQVGLPRERDLTAALFAYEVTHEVIAEARERGANLIIAFHPLIFPTLDAVTDATRTGDLIQQLIRDDIALYVLHTAFDTHPVFGTSRLMATAMQLRDIRVLVPLEKKPEAGMGVIGSLETPIIREELLGRVKKVFGTPSLRHNLVTARADAASERISRMAMVGGAGMEFYSAAVRSGAEAFITADVRYHDFHRAAHDGILLIDAGHAETEKFVARAMAEAGRAALNSWEPPKNDVILQKDRDAILLVAQTEPNAVRYFAPPPKEGEGIGNKI